VRGTLIALRKDQSNQIWVRLQEAQSTAASHATEKEQTYANA
jgi:hypothetical protein